jgi:predicted dinucleotide-binding enzyme
MKFGTIGAGAVASAFAREALAAGHEVVISARGGPQSLAGKVAELGRGASAATVGEAASLDYVFLAAVAKCRSRASGTAGVERPGTSRRNKSIQRI